MRGQQIDGERVMRHLFDGNPKKFSLENGSEAAMLGAVRVGKAGKGVKVHLNATCNLCGHRVVGGDMTIITIDEGRMIYSHYQCMNMLLAQVIDDEEVVMREFEEYRENLLRRSVTYVGPSPIF